MSKLTFLLLAAFVMAIPNADANSRKTLLVFTQQISLGSPTKGGGKVEKTFHDRTTGDNCRIWAEVGDIQEEAVIAANRRLEYWEFPGDASAELHDPKTNRDVAGIECLSPQWHSIVEILWNTLQAKPVGGLRPVQISADPSESIVGPSQDPIDI